MTSREEEKAYDISHNAVRRWWQPTTVMIGIAIITFTTFLNFFFIHQRQNEITKLVHDNQQQAVTAKHVANIAAADSYHNCVITRALETWSKALGATNPVLPGKEGEKRDAIYAKLHATLLLVDGQVCIEPPGYSAHKQQESAKERTTQNDHK
jgi:hypothetical protein